MAGAPVMRRGLDPFRAVPLLDIEERIESVACTDTALYVGTSSGALVHISLSLTPGAASEELTSARRLAAVRLPQQKPVEQVCAFGTHVFALSNGIVLLLNAADVTAPATILAREARCMCLHTGLEEPQDQPDVCIAFRKKLALYTYQNGQFEPRQEFPTSDTVCALAWHQSWVCAGSKKEYNLYSDKAGVPREICTLDGKVTPRIAIASGSELLILIQENVGFFFNLGTQQPSPKSTVTWPRKVVAFGTTGHYVLGSTGSGQVDVFGVRDQRNCQTLAVEGNTVSICPASGGRAIVASELSLTCLDPVPFERQVQKLLMTLRIADALDLLNSRFAPGDPQRDMQLSRLHVMAGWALFRDLQFLQAFAHFTYSADFKVGRMLLFWRQLLPEGWEPPSYAPPPGQRSFDEGAPEPSGGIEQFVRTRLAEKSSQDASTSAVTANVGIANAAMVSFLLRQREALLAHERLPPSERPSGCGDPAHVLRATDTVLLKLLIENDEDDLRLQQLVDSGLRCSAADLEAFLRQKQRLDVLARLWKANGKYDMVLQEWSAMLHKGSSGDAPGPGADRGTRAAPSPKVVVAELASALKSISRSPGGADLLRRYLPELLRADASAVPAVLAPGPRGTALVLPADEVLELLAGHADLARGFLEGLVAEGRAEARHCDRLAALYVAEVAEEQKQGEISTTTLGPTRLKLLKFLQEAPHLDVAAIVAKAESLGLHQERVTLCWREARHREALSVLVQDLNDLARAEAYCRIHLRRQQGRGEAAEASVFAAELPEWARAVVFGPRRTAADALGPEVLGDPAAAGGQAAAADGTGGSRPLMLLLQVLLACHAGAEQRPDDQKKTAAEYQEATIALLSGYAGHSDLPPHEVIGLLPSSWTLHCLAAYLAKSARLSLHDRRASMFEESLSSMAYLKTFNAWAQGRMQKVVITNDRCCPTCNRRFVDKDAVGKAFVAYPNKTCVHLQCKEDLSVCPKTGRDFSDNLSVYCGALGPAADA